MFHCPKCGRFVKEVPIKNTNSDYKEKGHCKSCNIDLECCFGGYIDINSAMVAKHHVTGDGIDKRYTFFE